MAKNMVKLRNLWLGIAASYSHNWGCTVSLHKEKNHTKVWFEVQVLSSLTEPGIVQREIFMSDTLPGEVSSALYKGGGVKPHWDVSVFYL